MVISQELSDVLLNTERTLPAVDEVEVPSRIVYLPLSWDDPATQVAIQKYMQSVRPDAPWCPSNIEFIRRINGLNSIEEVYQIVFAASYLVMGLGDVYLGSAGCNTTRSPAQTGGLPSTTRHEPGLRKMPSA